MDTACQDGASFQKKNDKKMLVLRKARALYLPARGPINYTFVIRRMKDENLLKNIGAQ